MGEKQFNLCTLEMSGFSYFPEIIFRTSKTFSKLSFFIFQKFEYVSKKPVVFILCLKTMKTAFLLSKQCRRKFYSAPFEQIWKEAFYDPLRVDGQLFINQLRYIDHIIWPKSYQTRMMRSQAL